MESWCRICSRSDEFRRFPLFSVADVSQEVIAKMITSCTDTLVSSEDGLPQQICPDCLITLSLAYSFRRLCRRTDAKFRETFDPRAPAEHMATGGSQPRRSQSQVGLDESGGGGVVYDSVPVIKEEVEFYEYECSAPPPPPPEDQWVIQNPRTIHEATAGAMTVLHNPGGQYQEEGGGVGEQPDVDDMMSSMVPMVTMEEGGGGLDPAEYGECSGSGQRKKKHEPERFSKRIRRQSEEYYEVEYTGEAKELEVLKTSRGKDLLALDGYMFYKNSQRGTRCYWECKGQQRRPSEGPLFKCPARVTTDFFDNRHELFSYKRLHTHPPDPTRIQEVKQRNLLKECAATYDSTKPSEIMSQVMNATGLPHSAEMLISKNAQRKIIMRARMEETPTSETVPLDAIDVPFECLQTVDGNQFYQGNCTGPNGTAFLFATQEDIKNLAESSFWLVASTYSAKTGLQRQLLTIQGSVGPFHQQAFPVAFVLLSGSSQELYQEVLAKIKTIAEVIKAKLNPQLVLTDFEQPLVNALEAEFPHTRQSVCFFHYSRQLFRTVEPHGLLASFEKNQWLAQNFKRVKALAFLPPEHIPDAFYVLKSNAPLELHRFLDDFAEQYIFGKVQILSADNVSRTRPQFPTAFWSMYTNIMQGIPNTYNQTKDWHYRMARMLTSYHSDPHKVFKAFRHEYAGTQEKRAALQAGAGPSRKTEDDHRIQAVRTITTNFTSYSTLQFLDTIADNLEGLNTF
uniref:(northern house mosquito) hypothetical protein n=1 Tax=Culex pipiens TaxID=7175 RepID=A0A8D8H0X5_CULPI